MTNTTFAGRSIAGTDTSDHTTTSISPSTREEPPMHVTAVLDDLPEPEHEPRPPGRSVARCADGNGTMTGLFFSDHVVDIARAKAMCRLCPLQAECLDAALERQEPWGVWGGELLQGGRIVRDKRPCGRPPKHPRPHVTYDEMGPVGVDLVTVA